MSDSGVLKIRIEMKTAFPTKRLFKREAFLQGAKQF